MATLVSAPIRPRRPRSAALVLGLVALLLGLGAGCSSKPATTGTGASTSAGGGTDDGTTDRDQAVRFAECMRSHGVTAFPDPDGSGQLTLDGIANGSSIDPSSAAFTDALAACKDLEPAGFTGHERNAQEQADALQFAQCVRDHGVKDFPDPDPDEPLVNTNLIPSSAETGGMAALNAAMQACNADVAGQLGGR